MCPNVLWKNLKLQTLHANNLKPVTSELSGDFHRDSTSLTSQFVQSYFKDCHHLCMFSHVSYSAFPDREDTWREDLSAKENPFFLLQQCCCCWGTARGGLNSAPARDLWQQFVLVFTYCKKSMRCKSKRKMALTGMKFYNILLPFQPACTFCSIVKFKCHGIDLSGNKFSQRQSLKKP